MKHKITVDMTIPLKSMIIKNSNKATFILFPFEVADFVEINYPTFIQTNNFRSTHLALTWLLVYEYPSLLI